MPDDPKVTPALSREDVELARGMAEYLVSGSYKRLDAIGIRRFNTEPANALNALADRIEALLPPGGAMTRPGPTDRWAKARGAAWRTIGWAAVLTLALTAAFAWGMSR